MIRAILLLAGLGLLLILQRPAARPGLVGVATPRTFPTVPGVPPPPVVPPPPPLAAMSGGQTELWPGYRESLCAGWHAGAQDFCAPLGTVVYAPAAGTLTMIGSYEDTLKYGAYVILTTPGGLEIYVGHLNHETVNPLGLAVGQWVEAGTPLGDLSEFAYSRPHAHVQLRQSGALVGPDQWWTAWEGR